MEKLINILLPVFNEEESLGELIDESQKKRKPIEAEVNLIYPSERIYKIWS